MHDMHNNFSLLAAKRSAGVTPEVNHYKQAMKHTRQGSTLVFTTRAEITRSPKQGYKWYHKKELCPPKIKKRNVVKSHNTKMSGP